MTTEEIRRGNKIIAEFMGAKHNLSFYSYGKDAIKPPSSIANKWEYLIGELYYHSSWDWLMPVDERIESLEDTINKEHEERCTFSVSIFNHCCDIQSLRSSDNIIEVTAKKTKIEAVFIAVVEFIKWYNDNNLNPTK